MNSSFVNQKGWNHYLLNHYLLIKDGEERSDVMRSFDWAARRLIDNENQEIPKEFEKWYEKFDYCSIEDQIFHDHEVRVVYWEILGDLCDDLMLYIDGRNRRLNVNNTQNELYHGYWESEIEEAFFEFLEAYKTISYENLFEESVHQNKYSENEIWK